MEPLVENPNSTELQNLGHVHWLSMSYMRFLPSSVLAELCFADDHYKCLFRFYRDIYTNDAINRIEHSLEANRASYTELQGTSAEAK